MAPSRQIVLLFALISGGFASARPKVDPKKDPVAIDAVKIGNNADGLISA